MKKQCLELLYAIGKEGMPSGHLYAALMGRMTLDHYNDILSILKGCSLVSESGYFLTLTDDGVKVWDSINKAING